MHHRAACNFGEMLRKVFIDVGAYLLKGAELVQRLHIEADPEFFFDKGEQRYARHGVPLVEHRRAGSRNFIWLYFWENNDETFGEAGRYVIHGSTPPHDGMSQAVFHERPHEKA